MIPYSIYICLKRDQEAFHASMEKRKERREQNSLKKTESCRGAAAAEQERRSRVQFFQLPTFNGRASCRPQNGRGAGGGSRSQALPRSQLSHNNTRDLPARSKAKLKKSLKHTKSFRKPEFGDDGKRFQVDFTPKELLSTNFQLLISSHLTNQEKSIRKTSFARTNPYFGRNLSRKL